MSHGLHCAKGGNTHICHNVLLDTFPKLLDEVCHKVESEPNLQSLERETFIYKSTGTETEARLGIEANGLLDSRIR